MVRRQILLWSQAVALTLSAVAPAQGGGNKRWSFGGSAGVLLPGSIEGSFEKDFPPDRSGEFQSNATLLAKGNVDFVPCRYFGVSACLVFSPLWLSKRIDLGEWDGIHHVVPSSGIYLADACLGLTTSIPVRDRVTVNPSAYAGYRRTFSSSLDARNSGVALDFDLTVRFHTAKLNFWSIDVGFLSQPYGGVRDVAWVRAAPVYFCGAGFGR